MEFNPHQARLARLEERAAQKQAVADAAMARVKAKRRTLNRETKDAEIKAGGRFARDMGLLKLARLDAEAFAGLMEAAEDPAEVERWRRRGRKNAPGKGWETVETSINEAAE